MEFHISSRFINPKQVKRIFDESFTKMPDWFKKSSVCTTFTIIGVDSNDTDRILRSLSAVNCEKRVFICTNRVFTGCVEIFGILLKEAVAEQCLQESFETLVTRLSAIDIKNDREINDLYRHLSLYHLEPTMRTKMPQRYELCRQMANQLAIVTQSPQNTPTIQ